ncbi:MAG: tetratricopeptide repeat protein [Desulfovibrionaceae bacterium]
MSPLDHDAVLLEFLDDQDGELLVLTEDDFFVRTLRSVLGKTVGARRVAVTHHQGEAPALRQVMRRGREPAPLVLLVERRVGRRPTTEFIYAVKGALPRLPVLLLTGEAEEGDSAFLHETGVDSILTKPASADDIIQKLANLVRPPEKIRRLMDQARALLTRGRGEEVLGLTDKVLALKPGSPGALMLRGEALLGLGRRDEARAAFSQAHEHAPLYLDPLKHLAEMYRGVDDAEHLLHLRALDEISPRNLRRKFDMGRALVRLGRLEEAEAQFDAAVERAREESMTIVENIVLDVVDALPEEAARASEKYLSGLLASKHGSLGPRDMVVFNRLGLALRRQGKWKEALENYRQASQVAPDDAGLHYNMALAHADGDQYAQAVAALEDALGREPGLGTGSKAVLANMADIFVRAGRTARAREFYQRALDLDPADRELRLALRQLPAA